MNRPVSLCDLLGANAVWADMDIPSKKQLLQEMSAHASHQLGVEEHVLFDVLWEREKLGTTGVGQGIAIPHGRVPGLSEVRGFFARLTNPIPFESVDDRPVDLVFMLLAPDTAGADHLHALAAVSRALRDGAFCEKLRKAKDAKAVGQLLKAAPTAEAA